MRALGALTVGSLFLGGCVAIAGISGYENVDDAGSSHDASIDVGGSDSLPLPDAGDSGASSTDSGAIIDETGGDSGSSDSTIADALDDGATDSAALDTGADAGRWCNTQPPNSSSTFCDDFDLGTFGASWDPPIQISGAGQIGPVSSPTGFGSPPTACHANVHATSDYAFLVKTLTAVSSLIDVRFDLQVNQLPPSSAGPMQLVAFDFQTAGGGILALTVEGGLLRAYGVNPTTGQTVAVGGSIGIVPGQRYPDVDLNLELPTRRVQFSINGGPASTGTLSGSTPIPSGTPPYDLLLGLTELEASTPGTCDVFIDNVFARSGP